MMISRSQPSLRSICRRTLPCSDASSKTSSMARRSISMMSNSSGTGYDSDDCSNSWSSSYDHRGNDSVSSSTDDDFLYESIDDLIDFLVAEATQRYAQTEPVVRINKQVVWSPERNTIDVAVKRLDAVDDIHRHHRTNGKTYYEIRILASGGEHYVCYDRDAITSVLIGYACLDGVDRGFPSRRYTFQDSQHLYKFCEVLGEKGRFEDAAF